MAQLIYLPLLLATIQLPMVSGEVQKEIKPWPLGGENMTISTECVGCLDQWIATFDCRAGKWIFKLKCCKTLIKKVKIVVQPLGFPEPKNWTDDGFSIKRIYASNISYITLKGVNGSVKSYHGGDEICLTGGKMDACKAANRCCKCFNASDKYINLKKGSTIHISAPSMSNGTVKIQFKENNKEINTTDHSITCKPTNVTLKGLRFYKDDKSWIDALKHCHSLNSSLVHITNKTVQKDVEILLENNCRKINWQRGVWIGLEKSIFGCNVPWMWTSGTEVEYDEWSNSSHIDPVNNHCGKIVWVNGTNYKWQDAHCFEKLPFICQDAP